MLYLTNLVDMNVANDTDIMRSDLKNCPVDFGSDKKKKLYLSTWYIENSTHGGAGDSTYATKEFGEKIHDMTIDGLMFFIIKANLLFKNMIRLRYFKIIY